jgi:HD-GYP domain-containing protein (c-di-GMP phosphodiesterase class II)
MATDLIDRDPEWDLPPQVDSGDDPLNNAETDEHESLLADDEVDVASLRAGMRLAQDVFDVTGVLLLASGMRITPRFLQLLNQRKIKTVRLRSVGPVDDGEFDEGDRGFDETTFVENEHSRKLDELLPQEVQSAPRLQPVRAWRRPRIPVAVLKTEAIRGLERHEFVSGVLANVSETLQFGGKVSAGQLRATMRNFVNMVSLDFDLLPLLVSMQRTKDEYLFDHAVNAALISMTIGAQLGLTQHQVMEVGLGALLHDVGMLRVPGQIRLAPRKLTPSEMAAIRRHPLDTLEMLSTIRGLPNTARIIAYQVHERMDGSGYPRGQKGAMLHPFSMIVAVADTYAASTRPRPYREAYSPYDAAKLIVQAAAAEKFEKTIVRAFLDAIALFPIGSIVELADGRRAVVVRANPDMHTKPVVEVLDQRARPTGTLIDLSQEPTIRVVHAHPSYKNVFAEYAEMIAPPKARNGSKVSDDVEGGDEALDVEPAPSRSRY